MTSLIERLNTCCTIALVQRSKNMLPNYRQFVFFNSCTTPAFNDYMMATYPTSRKLFNTRPPLQYEDLDIAFHEFAHIMDVVNRGKPEAMWVNNFGYTRSFDGWTATMIENELWVAVAGVILYNRVTSKPCAFSRKGFSTFLGRSYHATGLCTEPTVEDSIAKMMKRFDEKSAQIEPVIDDLANRTIEYMLSYEHK